MSTAEWVDALPWLANLTETGRRHCIEEIVATLGECAAVGEWDPLVLLVRSWREVATGD